MSMRGLEAKRIINDNIKYIVDDADVTDISDLDYLDILQWYEKQLNGQNVDTEALASDTGIIRKYFHPLMYDDKAQLQIALHDHQDLYA